MQNSEPSNDGGCLINSDNARHDNQETRGARPNTSNKNKINMFNGRLDGERDNEKIDNDTPSTVKTTIGGGTSDMTNMTTTSNGVSDTTTLKILR